MDLVYVAIHLPTITQAHVLCNPLPFLLVNVASLLYQFTVPNGKLQESLANIIFPKLRHETENQLRVERAIGPIRGKGMTLILQELMSSNPLNREIYTLRSQIYFRGRNGRRVDIYTNWCSKDAETENEPWPYRVRPPLGTT